MSSVSEKIIVFVRSAFMRTLLFGLNLWARSSRIPRPTAGTLPYETHLDDIYAAALKVLDGDIVDVGMNTGQTLFKLLPLIQERRYYGFEPQILAATSVDYFIEHNRLSHCAVLPVALSDHDGVIPIFVRGLGPLSKVSKSSSIVKGFRPERFYNQARYVYATRGDKVVEDLKIESLALIKIDVEGAELEVVRGLMKSLEKLRPILVFEVLHHYLAVTKEALEKSIVDFREARIQELEGLIRSLNYRIYQIDSVEALFEVSKIEPKFTNESATSDYVAVPEGVAKRFLDSVAARRGL